jgi:hypothetical protein
MFDVFILKSSFSSDFFAISLTPCMSVLSRLYPYLHIHCEAWYCCIQLAVYQRLRQRIKSSCHNSTHKKALRCFLRTRVCEARCIKIIATIRYHNIIHAFCLQFWVELMNRKYIRMAFYLLERLDNPIWCLYRIRGIYIKDTSDEQKQTSICGQCR